MSVSELSSEGAWFCHIWGSAKLGKEGAGKMEMVGASLPCPSPCTPKCLWSLGVSKHPGQQSRRRVVLRICCQAPC